MSVTTLTRWKGGKPDDMIKAAKQAKLHTEKHGAEMFRVSRFHTGRWVGQWLVATRFANWTAYAKAQDSLANDAEYQKLLAHVGSMAEMNGRTITVGVDL
jgi:hypothetical protein